MSAARADDGQYAQPEETLSVDVNERSASNGELRGDLAIDSLSRPGETPYSTLRQSPYVRWVKPVVDRVGAAFLLVATAPLLAGAALAVKWSMGSPILLRQDRVGQNGTVFTILKFRTMEPDRRRANPARSDVAFIGVDRRRNHKDPNDPRITGVGVFLRKWSLDELPQFINVIRGDMSLVGPRPEMVQIVDKYEPWQHARHAVKPGVTGPWQISERGDKPLHECTESDVQYLSDISLWQDLKILALTPLAALGIRRGA